MGRREEHALKQLLRITILLIGLIWILAWAAAGRFDDTPNTQDGSESPLPSGEIAAPGERDSAKTLRVQIQGEVQEMDMGTYLLGVLRAEMPASFEEEALKAQAIAARTYTLYRIRGGGSANHPDADACDDHTCCKAYLSAERAAANWGSMAVYYEEKLARAVSETDGEVILYDGAPILAVFFSSADGSTQGAGDVWMNDLPYLQKVDSPETEELVPNYYSVATFTAAEFKSLILAAKPDADLSGSPEGWIRDIVRNDSDYVASVTVGGVKLRGNDLRTILSLRSPSFTVEYKDNAFTFHVTGYGHGVGMSQYGANILAKQGLSAEEQAEMLSSYGISESGLVRIIRTGYDTLGLCSYFTAGPDEVRAWTIHKGWKAPQAAGVIHTDFERGFIRAEVISYADYMSHESEAACRSDGVLRVEGKEYVVQDGDVMHFLFNV